MIERIVRIRKIIKKYFPIEIVIALMIVSIFYYEFIPEDVEKRIEESKIPIEVKLEKKRLEKESQHLKIDTMQTDLLNQRKASLIDTAKTQRLLDSLKTLTTRTDSEITQLNVTQLTKTRDSLIELRQPKSTRWFEYLVYTALMGLAITAINNAWKKKLKDDELPFKDPPFLQGLFRQYTDLMAGLGTPRKIKRFSNKVRLQYKLLESEGYLNNDMERELFFEMIMVMEYRREILNEGKDNFPSFLWQTKDTVMKNYSSGNYFKQMNALDGQVKSYQYLHIPFLERFYDLNKNILV